MLKNKGAVSEANVGDERPRKKLSFRDPEVVPLSRNGPHSAPSVLMKGSPSLQRHLIMRPHSVSGMTSVGHHFPVGHSKGITVMSSGTTTINQPLFDSARSLQGRGFYSVPSSPGSSPKVLNMKPSKYHSLDRHQLPSPVTDGGKPPNSLEDKSKNGKCGKHAVSKTQKPSVGRLSKLSNDRAIEKSSVSLEDLALENQAMRIVRTVGQAFEVCHKMAVKDKSPSPEPHIDEISQGCSDASSDKHKKDELESLSGQEDLLTLGSNNEDYEENISSATTNLEPLALPIGSHINKKGMGETFSSPLSDPLPFGENLTQPGTPLSMHHEVQLMREQLEQQQQQTQAAVAQVHLLRDQLAAETAARLEAQARAHQLLVHNKELIEHIQQLVIQIREMEIKKQNKSPSSQYKVSNSKDSSVQLSSSQAEGSSLSWLGHLQRLNQQASMHSQLYMSFPDTSSPGKPSPTFLYPSQSAASSHHLPPSVVKSRNPSPRDASSPIIFPLPIVSETESGSEAILPVPRMETGQKGLTNDLGYPYEDKSSTPSLSSDGDPKHCSNQSSVEILSSPSGTQLYPLETWRLPQVPEDSVPLPPYGPAPLGVDRGQNLSAITRAASERYSRQETLAHLQRMAWARHTTK